MPEDIVKVHGTLRISKLAHLPESTPPDLQFSALIICCPYDFQLSIFNKTNETVSSLVWFDYGESEAVLDLSEKTSGGLRGYHIFLLQCCGELFSHHADCQLATLVHRTCFPQTLPLFGVEVCF